MPELSVEKGPFGTSWLMKKETRGGAKCQRSGLTSFYLALHSHLKPISRRSNLMAVFQLTIEDDLINKLHIFGLCSPKAVQNKAMAFVKPPINCFAHKV